MGSISYGSVAGEGSAGKEVVVEDLVRSSSALGGNLNEVFAGEGLLPEVVRWVGEE